MVRRAKVLSRRERIEILTSSLKKLQPLCVKRKNLFSEQDASDLLDELGIHIWIALRKNYIKKTYKEAEKLAYVTGRNCLTSIVRSRLTVTKRGASAKMVPLEDMRWLTGKSIYTNGVHIIDAMEAIVTAAVMRVGVNRADALVKALLYDWRKKKNMFPQQKQLMERLNRNRSGVRKLVSSFISDVHKQLPSSSYSVHDNLLHKIDGTWKSDPKG